MNQSVPDKDDTAANTKKAVIGTFPQAPAETGAGRDSFAPLAEQVLKEKQRTPGLKLFDVLLYPVFTNLGVFTISVAATYLTTRGGDRDASGRLIYGKFGQFFQKRGDWLVNKFKSMGMTHGQADMGKMVFFSFLDGSLLAPFVKMFEDRRESIAKYLDTKMGTLPEDMSVYDAEPKQTWLSVLGGRFATAAIVVPTAVALDKTGLNDTLFNKPGERVGAWLAKKPGVKRLAGKLDVQELTRVGFFEAFYTSVCTAGLYISSRFLARATDKRNSETPAKAASDAIRDAEGAMAAPVEAIAAETGTTRHHRDQVQPKPKPQETKQARIAPKPAASFREKYMDELAGQQQALAVV